MNIQTHLSLAKVKSNSNSFQSVSKVRDFIMLIDEPITKGGTNQSPAPLDYLTTALGGCTVNYLKYKAQKKGIDTGEIMVKVKLLQIENDNSSFKREIKFEKTLKNHQKEYLLLQSKKTPVTLVLNNCIINTKIRN